jgi:hypothetical protein
VTPHGEKDNLIGLKNIYSLTIRKLTVISSSQYIRDQKNYSVNLDLYNAIAEESYSCLGR